MNILTHSFFAGLLVVSKFYGDGETSGAVVFCWAAIMFFNWLHKQERKASPWSGKR